MIEAATVDLFGTIVDFSIERDEPPLVADLLDQAGIDADPDRVLAVWVQRSLTERARTPFRTVRTSLRVGARQTARELELPIDPERWTHALETLWASRDLQPGAVDALERLRDEIGRVGIVSNVDDHVYRELAASTGLDELDLPVVTSQQARVYKPHPRPFEMALERLDAQPALSVHVGDSAREDRAGARAVGMQARLVDEHTSLVDVVDDLV